MAWRPAISALFGVVLALVLVASPAGAAGPKAQPPASSGTPVNRVTFGIEPASATGGDGRPFLSYGATPGATLSDYVAALNYSTSALTLQVYATDAVETTGGGYGLLPPNATPTGVGSWITIPSSDTTVTVPPQSLSGPGQVVIPIGLHVPRDAQPGDHSGAIVVSLASLGRNGRGQDIELQQRVGTRLFVKVAGPVRPQLVLTVTHSAYSGVLNPVGTGHVALAYTVKNVGDVNLGLDQSVSFSPLIGSSRTTNLGKVDLLLPGAQVSETVTIPDVFPEVLDSRSITIKPFLPAGSNGPDAPEMTSTATVWAVPWSLIIAILILVVLAVLAYRLSRRRREGHGPEGHRDLDEPGGSGGSEEIPAGDGHGESPADPKIAKVPS